MKTITLTQGKVALVDDADFEWLNQWKWHAEKGRNIWYAIRREYKNNRCRRIPMHREILKPPANRETDHKDRNGLNNRRYNLRVATKAQNAANQRKRQGTSENKGVCWYRRYAKWEARIRVDGKLLHLGYFDSEIEAAKAYDKTARKYFGEFAYTNF